MSHADTERVIRDPRVDFVAFTGSVAGGHAVQRAASERFIGIGLELGGCDPVYVRHDADLAHADREHRRRRVLQQRSIVLRAAAHLRARKAPRRLSSKASSISRASTCSAIRSNEATTLGPVVRTAAADDDSRADRRIGQRRRAAGRSASRSFPPAAAGTPYLAPQVLLDADHSMPVMKEEIFGPVAGIMKVRSDEEAIALMNDTAFGLTAAIWTATKTRRSSIGDRINTGTWFMNRCDYLDPALAWVGVKDSGRGCTLSVVGYEHLTRPKSFHLRTQT